MYSFRCGEEGHGLKDCPVPAKCFYCAQEGHILRDCPTRPPPPVKSDAAPAASA
ncbi:hypothetical protein B0H15DRAFT_861527 [Mycena belliarum]|uniref:CCHC-type domain-containing protein n=1 Tax=Mycena belliarum TaxID=1033014 RepID=A0AAD6XIW1_9AGAR|nr:hypothetical protein B0H15DRAFT_861527 [Mycena belliae]